MATILLVEDDPFVRSVTALILEAAGHLTFSAGDAWQAREWCVAHAPDIDLLITDIILPGTGGLEFADEFSQLCPQAERLFMTGHAQLAEKHHLQKPFCSAALLEAVSARLRQVSCCRPSSHLLCGSVPLEEFPAEFA